MQWNHMSTMEKGSQHKAGMPQPKLLRNYDGLIGSMDKHNHLVSNNSTSIRLGLKKALVCLHSK